MILFKTSVGGVIGTSFSAPVEPLEFTVVLAFISDAVTNLLCLEGISLDFFFLSDSVSALVILDSLIFRIGVNVSI